MPVIDHTNGKLDRTVELFHDSGNDSLDKCVIHLLSLPNTIEIYPDLIPGGFYYTQSTKYAVTGCGSILLHGSINTDDATIGNPDAINAVWILHPCPRQAITIESDFHKDFTTEDKSPFKAL